DYVTLPTAKSYESHVDVELSKAINALIDVYRNCETTQQRVDLVREITTVAENFSPVAIDDMSFPTDIKTKGRRKQTKGSRLPSAFELAEEKEKAKELQKKREECNRAKESVEVVLDDKKKRAKMEEYEVEMLWPAKKQRYGDATV
ncbi:hypothetical protein EC973_009020, partial [Apophysomyces ossiformis]